MRKHSGGQRYRDELRRMHKANKKRRSDEIGIYDNGR
jgi:hypothetical protein